MFEFIHSIGGNIKKKIASFDQRDFFFWAQK